MLGVCQAEAERRTWLLSGHCCAERGGHAHWEQGFLPLPAPPPPCRATHILGSSRMHLWGDILSGER